MTPPEIVSFNDQAETLITILNDLKGKIDDSKLKAIGSRMRAEGQDDEIRKKQMEYRTTIRERKLELERLNKEFESLQRVEGEQKAMIDKLSNNEAA